MPDLTGNSPNLSSKAPPDFTALIRFLMEPFLESPQSLRIDCETFVNRSRVWVRVSFDGEDKGRVFGRGGRNIQAVRTVLNAVARLTGYSAYLDIYGSQSLHGNSSEDKDDRPQRRSSKPRARPRSSPRDSF